MPAPSSRGVNCFVSPGLKPKAETFDSEPETFASVDASRSLEQRYLKNLG